LEKATVKRFGGVFLKLVNLTAVICILSLIADIARTKSDSPITLLSSTVVTDVKSTRLGEGLSRSGTGGSVLNESGIKPESKPPRSDNTTNNQSDITRVTLSPRTFLRKQVRGANGKAYECV